MMAAITVSGEAVPGCMVECLGKMRHRPRPTSRFAAQWFAHGVTPEVLAVAPVVVFGREDRLQDADLRRRTRRQLRPAPLCSRLGCLFGCRSPRTRLGDAPRPARGKRGYRRPRFRGAIEVVLPWQQRRLHSAALGRVTASVSAVATAALAA